MLDPITALAITGNVLQFIDFGLKATSKTKEIYQSADGITAENAGLEVLTRDIEAVTAKLTTSSQMASGNDGLDDICRRCTASSNDLMSVLQELKVQGERNKWKSVRKGLKAVWGRKKVNDMRSTLVGWREEIQFHILVQLRSDIDFAATKQLERYESLDEHAKNILKKLADSQDSIRETMFVESDKSDKRHEQTTGVIVTKQEELQEGITETLEVMDANSKTEHESTRRELEQLRQAMSQIEEDMRRRDQELRSLLIELSNAHGQREIKRLQQRSNAVSIALYALVTVYESLQKMLVALQRQIELAMLSTNFKQILGFVPMERSQILSKGTRTAIIDSVINKPLSEDDDHRRMSYSTIRTCTMDWQVIQTVDYNVLRESRTSACRLLRIVDHQLERAEATETRDLEFMFEARFLDLEVLRSLVLISTILASCLSSAEEAANVLETCLAADLPIMTLATIGKIAGFEKVTSDTLASRCVKWGVNDMSSAKNARGITSFCKWLFTDFGEPVFSFNVVSPDGGQGGGAALFAVVEFFVKFGWPLTSPVLAMTRYGLQARVGKYGAELPLVKEAEPLLTTRDELPAGSIDKNAFRRQHGQYYLPHRIEKELEAIDAKLSKGPNYLQWARPNTLWIFEDLELQTLSPFNTP